MGNDGQPDPQAPKTPIPGPDREEHELGTFASPPCFLHELDPSYSGLSPEIDVDAWPDVRRWRKAERERLIAARLAIPVEERTARAAAVAAELDRVVEIAPGTIVGGYWPFRGELDLRAWLGTIVARGARAALPVVVAKGQPLEFRAWEPGAPLERGVWNIFVPAAGEVVRPTVVLAPTVGFDRACYRLGHGGGFFDRTLAALDPRPLVIGVGYPCAELATIYPQPHDIPMDMIITGTGKVLRA